jgi:hypothetical protein
MQTDCARPTCSNEAAKFPAPRTAIGVFLDKYSLLLCIIFVGIACVRIISADKALSLTPDEPFHLACAIDYLSNHEVGWDLENPPVARALEAIGPYLAGVRLTSSTTNPYVDGADMLARTGNVDGMVFRLRLGTLPFFLLACLVVGGWANHFFGKAVAVIAVALFTSLPTTLSDAGLGTTDMALAATTGAAFLAAILWAEKPSWIRAIVMGLLTALAFLSKSTALGYLAISVLLGAWAYWVTSPIGWRALLHLASRYLATFVLAVMVTVLVIWAAYWFSFGPVPELGISLPAPEYFQGLLTALNHNKNGANAYLLGEFGTGGWWYYFPVALAVKTPIAFLILAAMGIIVCFRLRATISYLLPAAFVLGVLLPAMTGRINIGVRHVAPVYLGLSIIAALGLLRLLQSSRYRLLSYSTAIVLLVWMNVSVGMQHPDYLAYFNGFAGKHPENILVDSNYDWGQDLKVLSKRLHQLGADHVALGSLDGAIRDRYREEWYGIPRIINVDDVTPAPGWTAVSASFVKSYRFMIPARVTVQNAWYERVTPTERLGPYFLYYVPPAGGAPAQNAAHP